MASLPQQFGTSIQHLSWLVPAGPGTLTGRIRYEGFQNLAGYDEDDNSTGNFSASTWTAGAGYSWRIDSAWTAGGRIAYGRNTIERYSDWAVVGDLGVRWTPTAPWSLAMSLLNIGRASTADSSADVLPTTVVIGGAWRFPTLYGWNLVALADFRHPNDEDWTIPVGIEAQWSILTLRTGFPLLLADGRPSLGAGLHWDNLRLDASVNWNAATGMTTALEFGLGL
jgi:hypothetical protein